MANNNSKKKTNTNNNKKVSTSNKKVNEVKKNTSGKKVENTTAKKKEVKKVTPKEEIKLEKIIEEKEFTKEVKKEKKTFKLTSKQRDILLVLLVVVVLVIALVLTSVKKLDITLPIALEGEAGFNEITYSQYDEKLNTEEPFVVVITRDGCGYCEQYKPVLETVSKEYGLPIYHINMSNLTSEEQAQLSTSNSYLRRNQWGTPTTLFMYGSTVVDSIGGYVDEDTFREFAKENFVVTKDE